MISDKKIIARVPEPLHRAVKLKAFQMGKTITQVVKERLEEWVSDDPPPQKKDD